MRPFLRGLLALALPAFLGAQQHDPSHHAPGAAAPHEEPTVVIFVRHGERGTEPADDPRLTPAGEQRALALVDALRDAKLDAVIHTSRVRTRDTALPVARQFGLTPEVVQLVPGQAHVDSMVAAIRRHQGQTVLVVGHSNTLMPYIAALGGPQRPNLCDHEYDGLYTLVLLHGQAHLVHGRFGAPNPPASGTCGTPAAAPMRP